MNDPEQLRLRLVNEMFIDTHCAFYNGRVRNTEELRPDDRAFAHTRYIADLIDLSGLSRDERLTVLDQPTRMQIELYQADEGWEQAVQICTEMLRLFPGLRDYQSKLADLHASNTISRLDNGTAKQKSLADAAILSKGIHLLEKTHEQYVYNVTFFEVLGHLHHLRAIKLANGGQLSEALLEVQKALMFNPYIEEAEKTRTKLIDMMTELRAQVQVLEEEWTKRPNAILSEEGQRLRTEAQRGFEPLATYTKSAEAEETATGFRMAQAHKVWHDVGLAKPEDRWDERALSLIEGLSHVLNNPPADKSGLANAWDKVAAQDIGLAELDSISICSFLERRLFGGESDQEATQTHESPSEAPVLTGASAKRWQRDEPFEYWLFSLRGLRVKIQAVAAIALLLLASGLAIREFSNRKARDIAYHQIQAAASSKDYLSVIRGAETFFSNPILSDRDAREQQVGTLYSEAIVRWFVSRGDELDAGAQAHIDRYRRLIVDSE